MKKIQLIMALLLLAATLNLSQPACAQASKDAKSAKPQGKAAPRNLAILIFDGVQILDYTGPYETVGHV